MQGHSFTGRILSKHERDWTRSTPEQVVKQTEESNQTKKNPSTQMSLVLGHRLGVLSHRPRLRRSSFFSICNCRGWGSFQAAGLMAVTHQSCSSCLWRAQIGRCGEVPLFSTCITPEEHYSCSDPLDLKHVNCTTARSHYSNLTCTQPEPCGPRGQRHVLTIQITGLRWNMAILHKPLRALTRATGRNMRRP